MSDRDKPGSDFQMSAEIVRGEMIELQIDNDDDPRWGNLKPIRNQYIDCILYGSPQSGMLFGTLMLTLMLETVVLKFVFFGVHFYIGAVLCLIILYLLLSLGYSDPGLAFVAYQKLQCHLDVGVCNQSCRHAATVQQEYNRFCHKCNIPISNTTEHCRMCNVCIVDYDHHCVFIGKCVGANNLGRFRLFLFLIFGTLIYGFISALYSVNQVKKIGSS